MQKRIGLAMVFAVSTLGLARAQSPDAGVQNASPMVPSAQAAPIVRSSPGGGPAGMAQVFDAQPSAGVSVRSDVSKGVETVMASGTVTELRVVQGRANVTVHHPADHTQILVDLPGGQVSLLKDGLYTFNAGTDTVRVLHGEAEAFAGAKSAAVTGTKGSKVKETQQLAFFPDANSKNANVKDAKLKAVNAYPYELTADYLPSGARAHGDGGAPYREGYYGGGYPYFAGAYGYPLGYGYYPFGYGYPFGVGLGVGFYGGFGGYRGGGFRR